MKYDATSRVLKRFVLQILSSGDLRPPLFCLFGDLRKLLQLAQLCGWVYHQTYGGLRHKKLAGQQPSFQPTVPGDARRILGDANYHPAVYAGRAEGGVSEV
jgi:hypothetical protein